MNIIDCLATSSQLYDATIYTYQTIVNGQYKFTFAVNNLYDKTCVKSKIYDINEREIINQGVATRPIIYLNNTELYSTCHFDICEFKLSLYIEDSIIQTYHIKYPIKNKYTISKQVQWAGKCQNNFKKLNYQYDSSEMEDFRTPLGQCVNDEYDVDYNHKFEGHISLYTSPSHQHGLGNKSYSYGSNIYAGIIVDVPSGKKLKFISANLDGQEVQTGNVHQGFASDYIYLDIYPGEYKYATQATLSITYEVLDK